MRNQDNHAMASGNVDYPSDFIDAWHTIVPKEEENELCITPLQFLERSLTRMSNHTSHDIRRWFPFGFSKVERLHGTIREREKVMRGMQTSGTAQTLLDAIQIT
jgi:hypothetical protein